MPCNTDVGAILAQNWDVQIASLGMDVTYEGLSTVPDDDTFGTQTLTYTPVDIKALLTVLGAGDKLVEIGLLKVGDIRAIVSASLRVNDLPPRERDRIKISTLYDGDASVAYYDVKNVNEIRLGNTIVAYEVFAAKKNPSDFVEVP